MSGQEPSVLANLPPSPSLLPRQSAGSVEPALLDGAVQGGLPPPLRWETDKQM